MNNDYFVRSNLHWFLDLKLKNIPTSQQTHRVKNQSDPSGKYVLVRTRIDIRLYLQIEVELIN